MYATTEKHTLKKKKNKQKTFHKNRSAYVHLVNVVVEHNIMIEINTHLSMLSMLSNYD